MVFLLSFFIFLFFALSLGIGVLIKGKAIKGSCGGATTLGPDGEPLNCSTCPNRKDDECVRDE